MNEMKHDVYTEEKNEGGEQKACRSGEGRTVSSLLWTERHFQNL